MPVRLDTNSGVVGIEDTVGSEYVSGDIASADSSRQIESRVSVDEFSSALVRKRRRPRNPDARSCCQEISRIPASQSSPRTSIRFAPVSCRTIGATSITPHSPSEDGHSLSLMYVYDGSIFGLVYRPISLIG